MRAIGYHRPAQSLRPRRIRLVAYGARLESVLGASPRGFESPILRQLTLYTNPGLWPGFVCQQLAFPSAHRPDKTGRPPVSWPARRLTDHFTVAAPGPDRTEPTTLDLRWTTASHVEFSTSKRYGTIRWFLNIASAASSSSPTGFATNNRRPSAGRRAAVFNARRLESISQTSNCSALTTFPSIVDRWQFSVTLIQSSNPT